MIDPNIPLQVQTPQFNLADAFQNAMALRHAQTRNQADEQSLADMAQKRAVGQKIAPMLGSGDYAGAAKEAYGSGDLETGMAMDEANANRAKQQRDDLMSKLDVRAKLGKERAQLLFTSSQIQDPAQRKQFIVDGMEQYRPIVGDEHIDRNIEQFSNADPVTLHQAGLQSLDMAKQLELQHQARQEGLDSAKFDYQRQHDLETDKQKVLENADKAEERKQNADFRNQITQQNLDLKQQGRQDKLDKQEADRQDAIANIDDTIGEFQTLKKIQDRTTTGPISGSAPVAAIRKMLPNSISGGEDLQRLEKGYNTLAVKAIGAFKAGGVSFGQLSNKEGEWIRSTQAALDTGGEINKEMLDQGIRLLDERKRRVAARSPGAGSRGGASGSWGDPSQPDRNAPAGAIPPGAKSVTNPKTGAKGYTLDGGKTIIPM